MKKIIRSSVDLTNKYTGIYHLIPEKKLSDNMIITNMVVYNTQEIKTEYNTDNLFFKIGGTNKNCTQDIISWSGPTGNNSGILTMEQINNSQINYFGREPNGFIQNRYLGVQIMTMSNEQWLTQIGGSFKIMYSSTDPTLNYVYIVGIYYTDIYFFNRPGNVYTGVSLSNMDAKPKTFLAKYDLTGNLVWVNYLSSSQLVWGTNVANDNLGNVYISGYYTDDISLYDINGTPSSVVLTTNVNQQYTFLIRYSSNGNPDWATKMGPSVAISMCCNIYNDIYIAGYYNLNEMYFYNEPGTTLELTITNDNTISSSFVSKLDSEGHVLWATKIDGLENKIADIAADMDGNIYLTGTYFNNPQDGILKFYNQAGQIFNYSEQFLDIQGHKASFICKIGSTGHILWITQLDGYSQSSSGINSCIVDLENNLYVTGNYHNKLMIYHRRDDDENLNKNKVIDLLQNMNCQNIFVVKYNLEGEYLWAKSVVGALRSNNVNSIGRDNLNNVYICGTFGNRSFVLKCNPHGITQWSSYIYSELTESEQLTNGRVVATSISVDNNNNNLYVSGWYDTQQIIVERNGKTISCTNPSYPLGHSGFLVSYSTNGDNNRVRIKSGNLKVLLELI